MSAKDDERYDYHHDNIPADHQRIKQIYYPNKSPYSHYNRYCD